MDSLARRTYFRDKIIILAYHGFTDSASHEGIENYQGKHLDIDSFRQHLMHLRDHYNVLNITDLIDRILCGKSIPDNTVIITIDDGYRSNYTLAYPLLKEYQIPASIYITTDFINKEDFLWTDRIEYALNATESNKLDIEIGSEWHFFTLKSKREKIICDTALRRMLKKLPPDKRISIVEAVEHILGKSLSMSNTPRIYMPLKWKDIAEISKEGLVSIGSHGLTHTIMTSMDREDIRKELSLSRSIIEEETMLPCSIFSYPNGGTGDFNELTKALLKECGYRSAVTTVAGVNRANSDPYELKRLGMSRETNLSEFKRILSGVARLPGYIKRSICSIIK